MCLGLCFVLCPLTGACRSTFHEDSRAYFLWYPHDSTMFTGEIPWNHPFLWPCIHCELHPFKVQYGIHRSLSQSLKNSWHQRRVRRRRQTRLRRFAARDLLGSEIHRFMVYVLRPWSALEAIHGIITCKLHSCVYIYIYRWTDRYVDR